MKIFLKISVLILICIVLFAGCSESTELHLSTAQSPDQTDEQLAGIPTPEPTPTPTPTPKPKRQEELNIAVCVYDANSAQDILFLDGIESVFNAKKNDYEVFDAARSSDTQKTQIEEAAEGSFDAIIVKTKRPDAIKDEVFYASEILPVITIPDIDGAAADHIIDDKSTEIAQEAAEILVDTLDEGRRVVIISVGEPSDVTTLEEQAFIDAAEAKELKIVGSKTAESREQAVAVISNWMLVYPNIKGIWAPDPEAISAAIEVTDVMDRTDVKIGGLGEDIDSITALKDEKLTVLGAQQPKAQGESAARAALVLGTNNYFPESAEASYAVYIPETYNEAAAELWGIRLDEDDEEQQEEN